MFKRLMIYFKEMYPITSWVGTFLCGFMVLSVAWRLGRTDQPFEWHTLYACVGLCFFSLLLRVMDEFKDYELDLRLFPDRPLPSGRVLKSDLKVLGWLCVAASIVASIWNMQVLGMAFIVLFYSYLMLIWFGIEQKIRASLPLALYTHHPIVFLHFLYLLIASMTTSYATQEAYYLLPICFMFTNWEISRKIKEPKAENDYVTYSRTWGPRVAASIALFFQTVVTLTSIVLIQKMNAGPWWVWGYILPQASLMLPTCLYVVSLEANKPLKQWAEAQIMWNVVYLLAAGWLG